jgi:D-glycero-alpha-D-manno-heptose-7-phosphate kinase
MNAEVDIRRQLTPDVRDEMGIQLVSTAKAIGCGARFTGAGGGGCLWALGDVEQINILKDRWKEILSTRPDAGLLDHCIDHKGVQVKLRDPEDGKTR